MNKLLSFFIVIFLIFIPANICLSAFPEDPPNDPDYDRGEESTPPGSIFTEQWNLYSFEPRYTPGAGTSGVSADLAWKKTIGRKEVIIAILDSGIYWNERDLVNQIFLNQGELPPPVPAFNRNEAGEGGEYDVNGDGFFNIQDYSGDPRVYDANHNGVIDAGDLILIFSDGEDNDRNGYRDDIAGWDFWEQDNNPEDNCGFGHGTFCAKTACAEGDNNLGGIGVAPYVRLLPVRVGDGFIVDANEFAQGLLYAADMGASSAGASLGAINNTPLACDAVDYAHEKGLLLCAASADEMSYHHNYPGNYDLLLNMTAIVPNSANLDPYVLTDSYMCKSNCTNYGGRIHLSFPAMGCASEATAAASGLVALVQSKGLELYEQGIIDFPLTADEVKQILTMSADDIDEPFENYRFPSQPGWEQHFGYGRANAYRALLKVAPDSIPPEVMLKLPRWFEPIDPVKQPVLNIKGKIGADRADSFHYIVEMAYGVEPAQDAFYEIYASHELKESFEGTLCSINLSWIPRQKITGSPRHHDQFTATLRVRAWDSYGNQGEDRRTVFFHHDPELLPGFPLYLGCSGESSPKLYDLNKDGADEIILATSDGKIHALTSDGSELPGWPFTVSILRNFSPEYPGNHLLAPAYSSGAVHPVSSSLISTVAIGNLGGSDCYDQVVISTLDGKIYAIDITGKCIPGFPVTTDSTFSRDRSPERIVDEGVASSPVLADLDLDGSLEIIVAGQDQHLYVWDHLGNPFAGFPVQLKDPFEPYPYQDRIISTPAVGDMNGDGFPEIVVGSNEFHDIHGKVFAFNSYGELLQGWPVYPLGIYLEVFPFIGKGVPGSPVMADIDGDGKLEVSAHPVSSMPWFFDYYGRTVSIVDPVIFGKNSNCWDSPAFSLISNSSFGDMDGDGQPEILCGTTGASAGLSFLLLGYRVPFQHHLSIWNLGKKGTYLDAFPRRIDDYQFLANPIVADLDGDGLKEAIIGTGGYIIHAFNKNGIEPSCFPKFTGGWLISVPSVGDINGDHLLELVAMTREGYVFAWVTTGLSEPGSVDWSGFHGDIRNTGCYMP